jgi:hypothetical protein
MRLSSCERAVRGGDVARMSAAGQEPGKASRAEANRVGAAPGAERGLTSGALLSELFGGIEGEGVQVELSALRILFGRCEFL